MLIFRRIEAATDATIALTPKDQFVWNAATTASYLTSAPEGQPLRFAESPLYRVLYSKPLS